MNTVRALCALFRTVKVTKYVMCTMPGPNDVSKRVRMAVEAPLAQSRVTFLFFTILSRPSSTMGSQVTKQAPTAAIAI